MKESEMIMPFIDESESFVNGFECGMIWTYLGEDCEPFEDWPIHEENSAQVQAICDHFGVECEIKIIGDGWALLNTK